MDYKSLMKQIYFETSAFYPHKTVIKNNISETKRFFLAHKVSNVCKFKISRVNKKYKCE